MRLRRYLVRSLRDGQEISVERSWRIWFARSAQGARIYGEQESAVANAPDMVPGLVDIERSRSTDEVFPITLNRAGLIVHHGPLILGIDAEKALAQAKEHVEARSLPAAVKLLQKRDLQQIAQNFSAFGQSLPADLFFPSGRSLKQTRTLALPEGKKGTFTTTYQTTAMAGSGWLREAHRRIVTTINGTERAASEDWSMEPI